MGRNRDNAPVGNTCPMIDSVIGTIDKLYKDCEDFTQADYDFIITRMEKIRTDNAELRDWGNELFRNNEELDKNISWLEDKLEAATNDFEYYKKECDELNKQISQLT